MRGRCKAKVRCPFQGVKKRELEAAPLREDTQPLAKFTVRKPYPEEVVLQAQHTRFHTALKNPAEVAYDMLKVLHKAIQDDDVPDAETLECCLEELLVPHNGKTKAAIELEERQRLQQDVLEESDWFDDDDAEEAKKAAKRRKEQHLVCDFCKGKRFLKNGAPCTICSAS